MDSPIETEFAILYSLPHAVLVLDSNQTIRAANPPFLTLFQVREADLLGTPLQEVLPTLHAALAQEANQRVEIHGKQLEFLTAPLSLAGDGAGGQLISFQDTTFHAKTAEALRIYEHRYRALFEHSNDAILILDADLRVRIANPQMATLVGSDLTKLLERSIRQLLYPDDIPRFEEQVARLKEQETLPTFEVGLQHEQGHIVPVELSMTLVQASQPPTQQIQLILHDISAHKRYEEGLENRLEQLRILSTADEAVSHSLDMDNVLELSLQVAMEVSGADAGFIALPDEESDHPRFFVNKSAGRYPPEIIGKPLKETLGVVGRVLRTREPHWVTDVHRDEDYYHDLAETQALMAIPMIWKERLVGVLALESSNAQQFDESIFQLVQLLANRLTISLDNARLHSLALQQVDKFQQMNQELQELNNELQRLNEELKEAELLKTDMLRIANHDLKNPLGIVRGYINLLEIDADKLPSEYRDYFEAMKGSLNRMETILNDFLTVEAVKMRSAKENYVIFDLVPLVEEVLAEYSFIAQENEQKLTHDLPPHGVALVRGDKALLRQAVSNLLSNALKYTQKRGRIEVKLQTTPDQQVSFIVNDNGYGIPEDRQDQLFSPFYRPKTDETVDIEGTGLGLYLVQNIVERHDGEIIFHSVYHEGSTFGFRLPQQATDVDFHATSRAK